ncbi:hypothetical protein CcaverHIS002_0411650 [Cutaneotrichosporon cavernicola]|uniref:F-box domain-containing protein n=1 Tax=Cutaneotrichosporon cavernicola TaxID=279322 RepID=A0AA48QWD4_9TREE|nr:uncharacterized protein CcaverHIS019_0411590 [Cutaneotrichosporon cavernicola]BEI84561.1 hypothetical protein CcaverHIS002_0411650 [Cutaneotrichosporon cavernicola]BEI92339.1 hypothetical protein CcaverHIS019_0411590 [Cutaneotrichosporon cavernicola]BEJ00108.1 hypothetical protein CcaverHIS631_0411500 [Cutaneotrichosporon cavernicola]BEJ07879.1 hypothetical protein CcaverHIS641_0411480 [Cutaneotrichosporon cavernicola]
MTVATQSADDPSTLTPSMASISLDSSAYPHILESVLAYAPKEALIALRGVSTNLRDRVDAVLCRHILFTSYSPNEIFGKTGGIPGLWPACDWKEEGEVRVLSHARVADIIGPFGAPDARASQLSSTLNRLEAVRLRHHPAGPLSMICPLSAPLLVTFTTLTEVGSWDHPAVAEVGPVPDGVERFVLNLRYDPGRSWMSQAHIPPFSRPKSLKYVVIVFTEKTTHQEEEVWFRRASKPMGLLNSIVLGMTMAIPKGVEYTLVDAETLRPEWLGNDGTGTIVGREEGAIEGAVKDSVVAGLKKWERWSDQVAAEAAGAIAFRTRAEYRAEVGEAAFELHTVE